MQESRDITHHRNAWKRLQWHWLEWRTGRTIISGGGPFLLVILVPWTKISMVKSVLPDCFHPDQTSSDRTLWHGICWHTVVSSSERHWGTSPERHEAEALRHLQASTILGQHTSRGLYCTLRNRPHHFPMCSQCDAAAIDHSAFHGYWQSILQWMATSQASSHLLLLELGQVHLPWNLFV